MDIIEMSTNSLPSRSAQVILCSELWLLILECLPYFDIKRTGAVSRYFRNLIDHPALDYALFRGVPKTETTQLQLHDLQLHPSFLLLHVCCTFGDSLNESYTIRDRLKPNKREKTQLFAKSIVAQEKATSPATSVLNLEVYRGWKGKVKNENGVTLLDVIESLASVYPLQLIEDLCPELMEEDVSPHREKNEIIPLMNEMKKYCGWSSIDTLHLEHDSILLTARSFDYQDLKQYDQTYSSL